MSDNTLDMLETIQREVKDGAGTWGDRQDMLRWAVNEIMLLRAAKHTQQAQLDAKDTEIAAKDAQIAERDATIAKITTLLKKVYDDIGWLEIHEVLQSLKEPNT
ncbi:hypothetical protein [Cohnella sp. JJ-181]|uniref:hypothetical protein n=1 Tax=Cohnella rhizoplanae TaxID=2974897 RepID=UPI0022FF83FC|nr:hypothetical protein [Cohnella sp. JJ-181]CAI6073196.1 hypothetical protein COHCIP112018_02376 [Cohnella sp. JJ-181]